MDVFKINSDDDDELMLEKDMFVDTISLAFFLLEDFQLLFVSESQACTSNQPNSLSE